MSLDKSGLQSELQSAFEGLGSTKTAAQAATAISNAVDTYVKTAVAQVTIPAGAVVINVTGGSGAPAVGVPNPAPIALNGDPDGGTGGLS